MITMMASTRTFSNFLLHKIGRNGKPSFLRNYSSSSGEYKRRIPLWARLVAIFGLSGGSLFVVDRYYFKPVRDMFDPEEAKIISEALKLDNNARKMGYDLPDASIEKLIRLYEDLAKKRASEDGLFGLAGLIAQKFDERQLHSNSLVWYKKAYPNILDELDVKLDSSNGSLILQRSKSASALNFSELKVRSIVAAKIAEILTRQRNYSQADDYYRACLNTMTQLYLKEKQTFDESWFQQGYYRFMSSLKVFKSRMRDFFEETYGIHRPGSLEKNNMIVVTDESGGSGSHSHQSSVMSIYHTRSKSTRTDETIGLELASLMDSYANFCVLKGEPTLALSIYQKACDIVHSIDPEHIRLVYLLNASSNLLTHLKMNKEALYTIRKSEELLASNLNLKKYQNYNDFLNQDPAIKTSFMHLNDDILFEWAATAPLHEEEMRILVISTLLNKATLFYLLGEKGESLKICHGLQEKALRIGAMNGPKTDFQLSHRIQKLEESIRAH